MHGTVHLVIDFIKQHAEWGGPVLFLVSFGESFVGISILFPGTTIMVIAGTMVRWPLNPHGILDAWPLLVGAILGAVLGDAISFWLGRHFGRVIEKYWYFVRHPEILKRGFSFFDKYGTASVFVGRFFGPVRAAIPLVAGIMGMTWRRFWIANIGSALIWAPALLLLGSSFTIVVRAIDAAHGWRLTISIGLVILLMITVWLFHRFQILGRLRSAFGDR
jgi:membrane protein DedA with SNARE-associated domain